MKPCENTICFAAGKECKILTATSCDGCVFMKDKSTLQQERSDSAERLKRKGLLGYFQSKYFISGKGEPIFNS